MSDSFWNAVLISFLTSGSASFQVVIYLGIGIVLTHPKMKVMNNKVRGRLSKIMMNIIWPCFSLVNFGTGMSGDLLKDVWIILIVSLVSTLFQILLSELIFSPLLNFVFCKNQKKTQVLTMNEVKRTVLVLATAFQNGSFIPIMFLESFVKQKVFLDKNLVNQYVALISIYVFPMQFIFYSFGVLYLDKSSFSQEKISPPIQKIELQSPNSISNENISLLNENKEKKNFFNSFTAKSLYENVLLKFWNSILKKLFSSIIKYVILNPPIIGMILGFIISVIPFLKELIFGDNQIPILNSFTVVCKKFGDCATPIAMIIAGSNIGSILFEKQKKEIFEPPSSSEETNIINRNESNSNEIVNQKKKNFLEFSGKILKTKNNIFLIFLSTFAKLIVFPTVSFGLYVVMDMLFVHYNFISANLRPIMFVIFIVESSTPVMISMNAVMSLMKKGEKELAEIMILHYLFCPLTLVFFSSLSLLIFCSFDKNQCTIF